MENTEQPRIDRSNLLLTIDSMLENSSLIFLEGEDGIGKSTIAEEFYRRHRENAIFAKIHPNTHWGYAPDTLQEMLGEQMLSVLGEKIDTNEPIAEAMYRSIIHRLERHSRRRVQDLFVIVDGLDEIEVPNSELRNALLRTIPIGEPGFKTIISWNDSVPDSERNRIEFKSLRVPSLSQEEAKPLFEGIDLQPGQQNELLLICRGIPGRLLSARRLLLGNNDASAIMQKIEEYSNNLFALEINSIHPVDPIVRLSLAIIAYDSRGADWDTICRLTKTSQPNMSADLSKIRFLLKTPTGLRFVSEAFRKFALTLFREELNAARQLRIDDLLDHPEATESLEQLPVLLSDAGRYPDLFTFLSPKFYETAIRKKQSLAILKKSNSLGLSAANADQRSNLVFQFSLNQSMLTELGLIAHWKTEIHAYAAVSDFETALAIANTSPLIEGRLCLLALLAKLKKSNGLPVETALIETIRNEYAAAELDYSEQRVLELAKDLIGTLPDISADIMAKMRREKTTMDADVAMTNVLMQADMLESAEQREKMKELDEMRLQIASPDLRTLTEVSPVLFRDGSTAESIVREASKISNVELRISMLIGWIENNSKNVEAVAVCFSVIDLMLKTASYSPNAGDFRKILKVLPHCSDKETRERLFSIADSIMSTLEAKGSTVDYVRLNIALVNAANKFDDRQRADDILKRIVEYADQISERSTRAECRAFLLAYLLSSSSEGLSERVPSANSLQLELLGDFEYLLNTTAAHFVVAKLIITTLARSDNQLAMEYARELNTERRRDQAFVEILLSLPKSSSACVLSSDVISLCGQIRDHRKRYLAIADMLQDAAKRIDRLTFSAIEVGAILPYVDEINNASLRCTAFAAMQVILEADKSGGHDQLKLDVAERLKVAWRSVDRQWERIRLGYEICAAIAPRNIALAREFLSDANRLKEASPVFSREAAWASITSLRLLVSAFAGLMPKDLHSEDELQRLSSLIEFVPSYGEQSLLWADLAHRFIIAKKNDNARMIVNRFLDPSMRQISDGDSGFKEFIRCYAAFTFWISNPVTAEEEMDRLPQPLKDEAYGNVCYYLLRQEPLFEPYAYSSQKGVAVDYDTAITVIALMRKISDDSVLSHLTEMITDSCKSKRLFTAEQLVEICRRLREVVSSQLPSKTGISHRGYTVYAECNIMRVTKTPDDAWKNLIRDAEALPNMADKLFVLTKIAASLPARLSKIRDQTLTKVHSEALNLPATYDKVQSIENLVAVYEVFNRAKCKQMLVEAMELTQKDESYSVDSLRRKLVDLAHRIDPEIAKELVSSFDNDPARVQARLGLRNELALLNASKDLVPRSQTGKEGKVEQKAGFRVTPDSRRVSQTPTSLLPDLAWRALAELNGGRSIALSFSELKAYIIQSSELPLRESFAVMSWVLGCLARLYSSNHQASTTLKPLFEATFASCLLAQNMIQRCTSGGSHLLVPHYRNRAGGVIRHGDHDTGPKLLREFLTNEVSEYLVICDPYFEIEDLDYLKYLLESPGPVQVTIVTHLKPFNNGGFIGSQFQAYWNGICSLNPPDTYIVLLETEKTQRFPIHDRWWITRGGGRRIGTSLSGLGNRTSEVSKLTESESDALLTEIMAYVNRTTRLFNGLRLKLETFTLQ